MKEHHLPFPITLLHLFSCLAALVSSPNMMWGLHREVSSPYLILIGNSKDFLRRQLDAGHRVSLPLHSQIIASQIINSFEAKPKPHLSFHTIASSVFTLNVC